MDGGKPAASRHYARWTAVAKGQLANSMPQLDMAFVHDKGYFRKYYFYANPKQRIEQTERYLQSMKGGVHIND
jgi:hypothetical protein